MPKKLEECMFMMIARVNSTRCPNKMIRPFAGTTLFEIAIKQIQASKLLTPDQVYVSLYDPELIEIAEKCNIRIFKRSYESAYAEKSLQVLYDWWDKLPYKYVVFLNPCHPLLKTETIDNFIQEYINSPYDGMFGVIKKKNYFWNKNHELITPWPEGYELMNTKAVEETYEAAHTLYAGRTDLIGENIWMGSMRKRCDPVLFEMDELECFDVDHEWQFQAAEVLYAKMK